MANSTRRAAVIAIALSAALALPASAQQSPPATDPPAETPPASARDRKVTTLLDYLEKDAYGKKLAAPFWVSRAMGVVSLARLPRQSATDRLMGVLEKDQNDVVRLLAWQAILARAPDLDAKAHQRWMAATAALADKADKTGRDASPFRGALRVALLDVLATAPPTSRSRKLWQTMFAEANAWEPEDVPTLDALGRTAAAWKSASLIDLMVREMADANNCVRAEYVLHAAGCDSPRARDGLKPEVFDPISPARAHPSSVELWQKARADASAWMTKNRSSWKEVTRLEDEPWKLLKPLFVPPPVALADVDPDDKLWTADLEIGRADVDQFQAVFVVDATGSMGEVIAWLRKDVSRVMTAFTLLCKEPPGMGLVFYRDFDVPGAPVTVKQPMTYKLSELTQLLAKTTADGGGDIPEAVAEGLKVATSDMRWATSKRTGKIIVLVGDAPPKPGTEAKCEAMVAKAAETGVKTYACKVTTVDGRNDLASFDAIARAGGGSTIEVAFTQIAPFRYVGPDQKLIPTHTMARPEAQVLVATPYNAEPPGERILSHVLADAMSPQYRDRVEPLARTLLANVQARSEVEKRLPFPANTPPMVKSVVKPQ